MGKLLKIILTWFIDPLIWMISPKCPECGAFIITTYAQDDTLFLMPIKSCPECDWQESF